jgi:DNA-binding MarR family transcriptional regulator
MGARRRSVLVVVADLPLPTLLSQPLIAFTIEFDNETEHRLQHRTTIGGPVASRRGPWLVSQVMWANFLQFVSADGVRLRELERSARITNLPGLQRWGYVLVAPAVDAGQPAPPRRDWVVRLTASGLEAQKVWRPLAGVIEDRWRARFGSPEIAALRGALQALVVQFDVELPPYLPVVRNQLFAEAPPRRGRMPLVNAGPGADLSVLLSQVLLAFTLDFERESSTSLPLGANVLRILTEQGVRMRDLPHLTGISKEANSMAVGVLARRGCAVVEPEATTSRTKLVRLTREGRSAQDDYQHLLAVVEQRWRTRYGAHTTDTVRRLLHALIHGTGDQKPQLSQGLQPFPDGWRARKPYLVQTNRVLEDPGKALPHYPMVLHRGGWPDGS